MGNHLLSRRAHLHLPRPNNSVHPAHGSSYPRRIRSWSTVGCTSTRSTQTPLPIRVPEARIQTLKNASATSQRSRHSINNNTVVMPSPQHQRGSLYLLATTTATLSENEFGPRHPDLSCRYYLHITMDTQNTKLMRYHK